MKIIKLVCLMATILLFASCQSNKKEKSDSDESVEVVSETATMEESVTDESVASQPENGALLFDISHSTRGYLDSKSSNFRGVISQYGRLLNIQNFYLYGDSARSTDSFYDLLNSGNFSWSAGSDINSMLKFMIRQLRLSNDVVCLVSDGIMSGTNEQIRANAEYNLQSKEVLMNQIRETVEILGDRYSVLIVRYVSPFKGTYYCYNNQKVSLNCERPYFAIVLGKWDKVKWIEQDLISGKNSQKTESYYKYTDLIMLGDAESYSKCNFTHTFNTIKKINGYYQVQNRDSIAFACSINDLPTYMQTETYFDNNFKLSSKRSGQMEFNEIPREKYNLRIDTQNKRAVVSMANAVKINTYISGSVVRFELKYVLPSWVNTYSDENDLDIANNQIKQSHTFNLKYLIRGFGELNKNESVIHTEMNFCSPKK